MKRFLIVAALAAIAMPAALPAQGGPVVQPSAGVRVAAQRFARAYLPIERTTGYAREAFRRTFPGSFDSVPQNAALEKRFPGIRAAAQTAGERTLAAIYARELPGVQALIAEEVAKDYTAAELDQVSTFIESPAGQAVLAGAAQGSLSDKIAADMKAGRRATLTQADLAASIDPAVLAAMPEDQLRAALAFAATPAAVKFNANGTKLAQLVADRTMAIVQTAQPEMIQAISTAMAAHAGKAK